MAFAGTSSVPVERSFDERPQPCRLLRQQRLPGRWVVAMGGHPCPFNPHG
jgi:hypothetical protein